MYCLLYLFFPNSFIFTCNRLDWAAGSGSASTERTSEEHSSIEGQAGINMCQIDPFCGSAPTNLSHNMNTKIIKESCNPDATNQPHDATHENVDAGNHSHHIHQIVSAFYYFYLHIVDDNVNVIG